MGRSFELHAQLMYFLLLGQLLDKKNQVGSHQVEQTEHDSVDYRSMYSTWSNCPIGRVKQLNASMRLAGLPLLRDITFLTHLSNGLLAVITAWIITGQFEMLSQNILKGIRRQSNVCVDV